MQDPGWTKLQSKNIYTHLLISFPLYQDTSLASNTPNSIRSVSVP